MRPSGVVTTVPWPQDCTPSPPCRIGFPAYFSYGPRRFFDRATETA